MKNRVSLILTVLLAMAVPGVAQTPLVSSPASGALGVDPATALTLAWTTVPNAAAYEVELSENPSFVPLLPLKDARIPAEVGRLGQSYLLQFADGTALQSGRTYNWRVSAIVNGNRVTGEAATFATSSDPFSRLADRNLTLTRAEDGVDKDKPATIGFIRQGGSTPSQQLVAEFLLGWHGDERFVPRRGSLSLSPSFVFASKMSSDKQAEDTLAKVAGGVVSDWSFGKSRTRSFYQTVDIAYEGDQAFDDPNLLVEYLLTYSGLGVGRFHPTSAAAPVQILARPYFLATFAKRLKAPASMLDDSQTRIGPQVDVKVRLNALARALGISGTLLAVTDRWYSLSGSRDDANFFSASVDFRLAKGFAFGYAYKRGHDAPAFRGVNRMALTVGVGFGG